MAERVWAHLIGQEPVVMGCEEFMGHCGVMRLGHPSDPYRTAIAMSETPYGRLLTRMQFVQDPPIDPRWFVTQRQAASKEWVTLERYATYAEAVQGHRKLVEAHHAGQGRSEATN